MPATRDGTLGPVDQRVFDAVRQLLASQPYSPSVREIAEAAGLPLITAHDHLARLRYRGLIDWSDRQPRTVHLVSGGP